MIDIFVTRTRFHRMLWDNSYSSLTSRIGLSQPALADLCRENGIPLPPGIDRDRPATGNPHMRARPPAREVGQNSFVFFHGDFSDAEQALFFEELLAEPLEDLATMVLRFRRRLAKINHALDPFGLHPAIASVLPVPQNSSPDSDSIERRRLNLLNELFLYTEAVGGTCRFGGPGECAHAIRIGHMTLQFTLIHAAHSGRLRLDVKSYRQLAGVQLAWEDKGPASLETILPEIMAEMGTAAEIIARHERDDWRTWSPIASHNNGSALKYPVPSEESYRSSGSAMRSINFR